MNPAGPVFVLEVQGGHALPSSLRLEGGRRLEPISIGSRGQWPLTGMSVRDVHGYLAFDGATLYVQSANPLYPLRVEGSPVPSGWQPVPLPGRIQVGGITLVYMLAPQSSGENTVVGPPETQRLASASDQDATRYNPMAIPEPPRDEMATRVDISMFETRDDDATRPGVPLDEDVSEFDKTRVNYESPLHAAQAHQQQLRQEQLQHDMGPPTAPIPFAPMPPPAAPVGPATDPAPPMFPAGYVPPRPAAGMPAIPMQSNVPAFPMQGGQPAAPGMNMQQTLPLDPAAQLGRTRPGGAPSPILDLPPPAPAPTTKAGTDFKATAKELVTKFKAQWKEVSLPKKAVLLLLPLCFIAVFVLFDDKSRSDGAPARPAPSAASSSATTATARAIPPGSTAAGAPTTSAPAGSQPHADLQPTATPTAPPATSAAATSATASAAPAPPPLPAGGKTPERLAVDAVAAGSYAEAAQRYEALAREHPDQPAYGEAARILRSRLDAGTP